VRASPSKNKQLCCAALVHSRRAADKMTPCLELEPVLSAHFLIKSAALAAALASALLLGGCGRKGPPVPLDAATPAAATPGQPKPAPRPRGDDAGSLRAGAPNKPFILDPLL
jgi:predicted small lipoprotein YifL